MPTVKKAPQIKVIISKGRRTLASGRQRPVTGRSSSPKPGKTIPAEGKPKPGKAIPQQKITFKKGFGRPLDLSDIQKRHEQFLRQQREGKVKVTSIVGRDPRTGRRETLRVKYKRGVKVAAERQKQFALFGELEVIKEMSVTSSWVDMIHLVKFRGEPALAITFRDGFTALYPTTNIRDYEAMSKSASEGKFVWAALYHGRPGRGAPYISIGF